MHLTHILSMPLLSLLLGRDAVLEVEPDATASAMNGESSVWNSSICSWMVYSEPEMELQKGQVMLLLAISDVTKQCWTAEELLTGKRKRRIYHRTYLTAPVNVSAENLGNDK